MSAMHHHPHTEVAQVEADTAATRASVVIGEVSRPDELDELRDTLRHIWGPEVVPPRNLLRGMALGGACLLVAREDGRPVGFALGFLGWVEGVHLHSHQVGVIPELRAAGVGYALKLAQRAQALRHGVAEMRWTYDPMLYANARFNLVRLGAEMVAFHPHCYGDRHDTFNSGDRTDRVPGTRGFIEPEFVLHAQAVGFRVVRAEDVVLWGRHGRHGSGCTLAS